MVVQGTGSVSVYTEVTGVELTVETVLALGLVTERTYLEND